MRILFVAMPDSVHTARWLKQLADQNWDVHLFPVYDGIPHEDLTDVTVHTFCTARPRSLDSSVRLSGLYPLRRGSYRLSRMGQRFFPQWMAPHTRLASLVRRLKPDIVHSLEVQRGAYLTLEAKAASGGKFPSWLVSAWGSDLYLFGRLAAHSSKVKAVLSSCNYFTADCERDIKLAQQYGFTGETFSPLPVAGGFDIEQAKRLRQPQLTSARRLVTLKGYQNWAGRALNGLQAIELCADVLRGYSVAIYLSSPDVAIAAELMSQSTGIPVKVIPKCSHSELLRLHGEARISVAIGISDGLPLSTMEAALMGSFPIQTNTSCADEWLSDGESVLFVPPDDTKAIAAAIRRAITDDALVNRAAEINFRKIAKHLNQSVVQSQVIEMYEKIYTATVRL